MADEIHVTIDGQPISVPKGTLVVEAARRLGIEIPVYCYHPKMAPVGACRVCAVEVVPGRPKPIVTACTTECTEGLVVQTRSPAAHKAREGILEFLLINHPLDCPVCDRGGECDLQDFTLRYGPGKSRFVEEKRHFPKSIPVGRNVVLDRERCIMCQRCVRFCSEVAIEDGLVIIERGPKSHIGTFEGRPYDSPFSGNTIEICPVGALTAASYRFKARPWELQNHDGVCTACAMGCNVTVDVRFDCVARIRSRTNDALDDGWLCDRGREAHQALDRPGRLLQPMVRRGGDLVAATWEEALATAAEGLHRVQERHGAEAVGAVAGPRLGNEAGWLLVRLMRGLLKSPHVDHRRGQAWREGPHGVPDPIPATATVAGLDEAQAVVVAGVCATSRMPVVDLRLKKALRNGAKLLILGERPTLLDRYAHVRLQGDLGADLEALLAALPEVRGEPAPEPPALRRPEPAPWQPGGKSSPRVRDAAEILARAERVTILFPEDLDDPAAVDRLVKLATETGGQKPWGLLPLLLGANSRGLREMGVLPRLGPGGRLLLESQPVSDAWGGMAAVNGREYRELVASPTPVRGLVVAADDPFRGRKSDLEFLVVSDLFLSETAAQADVVFPASSVYEQVQTFTACDGTVQLSRQALPPAGESRPDWKILRDLAATLGEAWDYPDAAAVFAEIGRVNPLYLGTSYRSFQVPGHVHWSYPIPARVGAPRPDLSAIPVTDPTAAPVAAAPDTHTAVENVARIFRGQAPPEVPGQTDPRRTAARLSLDRARRALEEGRPLVEDPASVRGPQPPGPSPAWRYHHFGVAPRHLPPDAPAPEPEPAEEKA